MDEEAEIRRGERARLLIEDELLIEAFSIIRSNLHADFENSKANQSEQREGVWHMLKALNEVERHLRSVMETGKMAKMSRQKRREEKDG